MKILVIEDSSQDQIFITTRLRKIRTENLILKLVDRLKSADEALASEHFDLILLDKFLPDSLTESDCIEFIQRHADQRIVLLTGDDSMESVYRCLKAGALDFWAKQSILRDDEIRRMLMYAEPYGKGH